MTILGTPYLRPLGSGDEKIDNYKAHETTPCGEGLFCSLANVLNERVVAKYNGTAPYFGLAGARHFDRQAVIFHGSDIAIQFEPNEATGSPSVLATGSPVYISSNAKGTTVKPATDAIQVGTISHSGYVSAKDSAGVVYENCAIINLQAPVFLPDTTVNRSLNKQNEAK